MKIWALILGLSAATLTNALAQEGDGVEQNAVFKIYTVYENDKPLQVARFEFDGYAAGVVYDLLLSGGRQGNFWGYLNGEDIRCFESEDGAHASCKTKLTERGEFDAQAHVIDLGPYEKKSVVEAERVGDHVELVVRGDVAKEMTKFLKGKGLERGTMVCTGKRPNWYSLGKNYECRMLVSSAGRITVN